MTNYFNTLPYRITGDNPATLAKYDLNSRKKIIQLGYLALLPALIWFGTAFLTSYSILGYSLLISLLVSSFCFAIILIVERSIVMSKKISRSGMFFRSLLAVFFALIGSSMIDLIIYQDDIDFKIKSELIARKEADYNTKSNQVNAKTTELHNEMFGKGGTGMKGYHSASKSIENQVNDMKVQRDNAGAELDSLNRVIGDPSNPYYKSMMKSLGMNTIVYRHEKLFEILLDNKLEIVVYLVFLFAAILLETLPLIMKVSFKDSQYEKDIEAQEQLIENRRKGILAKSDYYTQMSHHQQNAMGSIHNYDRYSALN
jgi:hypothetical protein